MARRITALVLVLAFIATLAAQLRAADEPYRGATPEVRRLMLQAETLFRNGSYADAIDVYQQIARRDPAADAAAWIEFRLADAGWRSMASQEARREGRHETHLNTLRNIVKGGGADERDRRWAEANESLFDYARQLGGDANQPLRNALDWWAGARDVDLARERYLSLVFRAAGGDLADSHRTVPLDLALDAKKIAKRSEDRGRAALLTARALERHGRDVRRITKAYEDAAAIDAGNPVHDLALFEYGVWLTRAGRIGVDPNGGERMEPDFVQAVKVFRQLIDRYGPGQSARRDDAERMIREITEPAVQVAVHHAFLPESIIEYHLGFRNVADVDLQLRRIDLIEDVDYRNKRGNTDLLQSIGSRGDVIQRWSIDRPDAQDHAWRNESLTLDKPLDVGAYVLEARGGGKTSSTFILVSDLAVITKAYPSGMATFVCDAVTGEPVAEADVRIWDRIYRNGWNGEWNGRVFDGRTDADGVWRADLSGKRDGSQRGMVVLVRSGDRMTLCDAASHYIGNNVGEPDQWRILAETDRPAYRPGDEIRWKITARAWRSGEATTPTGERLKYIVRNQQGEEVDAGEVELNRWGAAWGAFTLDDAAALGAYNLELRSGGRWIGNPALFRLEEYKLPEYEVTVAPPTTDDGAPMSVRLGDTIPVTVNANYYAGGPVANATVEVVVRRRPFWYGWRPRNPYPWLEDVRSSRRSFTPWGEVVLQQTLQTDGDGRAIIALETERFGANDVEYVIEARVTDSSRREVVGSGSVKATRQGYFVTAHVESRLTRPGRPAAVRFHAADPNGRPMSITGKVTITREVWKEVWLSPEGREITGLALAAERRQRRVFPPEDPGWRCRFRGYESEVIEVRTVDTNEDGDAEVTFTPDQTGFFRLTWRSPDEDAPPVTATGSVWSVDRDVDRLDSHHEGLELIVDRDTFKAGDTAGVMIATDGSVRTVLFGVEGSTLYDLQVLRLNGDAKLVQIPLDARHTPNITLTAAALRDANTRQASEAVTVAPVNQLLTFDVATSDAYEPRETGDVKVTVTDADGHPVSGVQVSMTGYDASLSYIQEDLSGDPRAVFFRTQQPHFVATTVSVQQRPLLRLAPKVEEDEPADGAQVRKAGAPGGMRGRRTMAAGRGGEGAVFADAESIRSQAPAAAPMEAAADAMVAGRENTALGVAQNGDDQVVVRTNFRSDLLWSPDLVTDENGVATAPFTTPDTLTRWTFRAQGGTDGMQFGRGETSMQTRLPLVARLQSPRFFVVGDTSTITGVIQNNTDAPLDVDVTLGASGITVRGRIVDGRIQGSRLTVPVTIAPNRTESVEWAVIVHSEGEAEFTLTAKADAASDAMQLKIPKLPHGIDKYIASSGKLRADDRELTLAMDLPAGQDLDRVTLEVSAAPSIATTMLDAIPYLIDYPYGCTEQTMSRFLPLVAATQTLRDRGLDPAEALNRVFGGVDHDNVEKTHRDPAKLRANVTKMDEIAAQSIARLIDFQHGDGGWGWWKDGSTDHWMTAYVVWGLTLARDAGLDVPAGVIERGVDYLDRELVEARAQPALAAWMLHAIAAVSTSEGRDDKASVRQTEAMDRMWEERRAMTPYTTALMTIVSHGLRQDDRAAVYLRNLANGARIDRTPDSSVIINGDGDAALPTVHWGGGARWRWWEDDVETTAWVLQALLAMDPGHELVEPAMNWLVKNRRGAHWSNTRDTAFAVLALNRFLDRSGEIATEGSFDVFVNGRRVGGIETSPDAALGAPMTLDIDGDLVRDGRNTVTVRRTGGDGVLYVASGATFWSTEEPITPAGEEIFVRRDYYRLIPRETLLKGVVYDREHLRDGGYVESGERIEVVLTVETKNDYHYLLIEDMKPSGVESTQVRSGEHAMWRRLKPGAVATKFGGPGDPVENPREPGVRPGEDYTGASRWAHMELRDERIAIFVDRLDQGFWEFRYDLRAETPGQVHALPTIAHAMYAPEVRGNSAETRLTIQP